MRDSSFHTSEEKAVAAFSKQSAVFDAIYVHDGMIRYKRGRVWQHLADVLRPESHVLELNCGTGEDAIWLAQQGHFVMATDAAEGMLTKAREKIKTVKLEHYISTAQVSFTGLAGAFETQQYDHIFSNFGGLNCTAELDKVLQSFSSLLRPGGRITLVILPSFCLWETLLMFRGKFRTAFRRFFAGKGRKARVEGMEFRCWYYAPSFVKKNLGKNYKCLSLEGLCTLVPPSYIKDFDQKYPRLFQWLSRSEAKWKTKWPWRSAGDYFIISFEKIS